MKRLLALLLAFVLLLSLPCASAADGDSTDELLKLVDKAVTREKLGDLLDIIEQYSLYEYDGADELLKLAAAEFFTRHPELFEEFANDLFATQDRYSHYMEPSTYDSSYVLTDSFVGIGIELDALQDGVIVAVLPNTPAEQAGLKAGDIIISANGAAIENSNYKAIQEKLRGEEGTEVTVGVLRNGEKLEFTMTRRKIELSNIALTDMGNGVAYIRIAHFGDMPDTFFDFVNAYSDLDKQGYTSVIFDVRDNGGGSLDTLLNMLNYAFWEKDLPMFSLRFRDDEPLTYYSLGAGWEPETMVVLTNSNTASAAELFAGALGYMEGAWIVGEEEYSFGKGVGQNHLELSDGSYAVITTMEVLVGEDISYNEVGIPSDIVAPDAFISKDELLPLYGGLRMFVGASGRNVRALEQRLCLLGYLTTAPDGVLTEADMRVIDRFRDVVGLDKPGYVDAATAAALQRAMADAPEYATYDSALSEALRLCGANID